MTVCEKPQYGKSGESPHSIVGPKEVPVFFVPSQKPFHKPKVLPGSNVWKTDIETGRLQPIRFSAEPHIRIVCLGFSQNVHCLIDVRQWNCQGEIIFLLHISASDGRQSLLDGISGEEIQGRPEVLPLMP